MSNTENLQSTVQMLVREVSRLTELLSPFVGTDEMCRRYDCTPKTLNNMERDGRIPFRKGGKWNRTELMGFESKIT